MSDPVAPNDPQDKEERLRAHPEERFAGPTHLIDLDRASADLRGEPRPTEHGHRQKTLYRHGRSTVALFLFESGARMAAHKAAGTVVIQVLEGRLRIDAGGEPRGMGPGQLLVLAAGVVHDVVAEEASRMLLTVHLEAAK